MQCPVCRSYDVSHFEVAARIPGGPPTAWFQCRACSRTWGQPAGFSIKEEASPAMEGDVLTRLVQEKDELQGRLERLWAFLGSETFLTKVPQQHQVLLWTQSGLMQGYLNILNKRLELPPCTPMT